MPRDDFKSPPAVAHAAAGPIPAPARRAPASPDGPKTCSYNLPDGVPTKVYQVLAGCDKTFLEVPDGYGLQLQSRINPSQENPGGLFRFGAMCPVVEHMDDHDPPLEITTAARTWAIVQDPHEPDVKAGKAMTVRQAYQCLIHVQRLDAAMKNWHDPNNYPLVQFGASWVKL